MKSVLSNVLIISSILLYWYNNIYGSTLPDFWKSAIFRSNHNFSHSNRVGKRAQDWSSLSLWGFGPHHVWCPSAYWSFVAIRYRDTGPPALPPCTSKSGHSFCCYSSVIFQYFRTKFSGYIMLEIFIFEIFISFEILFQNFLSQTFDFFARSRSFPKKLGWPPPLPPP